MAIQEIVGVTVQLIRFEAACLGGRTLLQKFKEQTNAKERVVIIIIQESKRGEVDEMNIEDSCQLILTLLKTLLPVHYLL